MFTQLPYHDPKCHLLFTQLLYHSPVTLWHPKPLAVSWPDVDVDCRVIQVLLMTYNKIKQRYILHIHILPMLHFTHSYLTNVVFYTFISSQCCILYIHILPMLHFTHSHLTNVVFYTFISSQCCILYIHIFPMLSFIHSYLPNVVFYTFISYQCCRFCTTMHESSIGG